MGVYRYVEPMKGGCMETWQAKDSWREARGLSWEARNVKGDGRAAWKNILPAWLARLRC